MPCTPRLQPCAPRVHLPYDLAHAAATLRARHARSPAAATMVRRVASCSLPNRSHLVHAASGSASARIKGAWGVALQAAPPPCIHLDAIALLTTALLAIALLVIAPAVVAVEGRAHPPLALPLPLAALAAPPADLDPGVRLDVAAAVARRTHLDVGVAVALLRGAVVVVARRLDGVVQLHHWGVLHRDGRRGLAQWRESLQWRGVAAAVRAVGRCVRWAMVCVALRAMEWSSSGSRSLPS